MDHWKSLVLLCILFAAGITAGLLSLILDSAGLMIVCMALIFAGLIQHMIFFRCPSCGGHLGRGLPNYCPHCGEKLK